MQPINSDYSDPDPPNSSVEPESATWRGAIKNGLLGLNGWQAVPAIIIALYVFLGTFGPSLATFDPQMSDLKNRLCPPLALDALNSSNSAPNRASECSATNILGTDQIGRDVFSRLLHGTRTSLSVVGPSVLIGTVVGVVIGALVNGLGRNSRLVAYAILGLTIVPFAILVFGTPGIYLILVLFEVNQGVNAWIEILTSSTFSAVLTFALIAVAYQYDEKCRRSWFSQVGAEDASIGFFQLLRKQIVALVPWIGLAALANAALVFLYSAPEALPPAIAWSFEREYLFNHIGMFSPFVPMVLFPIAFVTFGTWWFIRHIWGQFTRTSKATLGSAHSVADSAEGHSTEEESDRFETHSSENDGNDAFIESDSRVKRRRWMMVIFVIVAATAVVRFGVAEAIPIVRELAQDSAGSYESAWAKSWQEWREATNCAREINWRMMELEPDVSAISEIEVSQRCQDLYIQTRNTPSHRHTIDYALRFLAQTLTLALVASIASAVLWTATSVSTRAVKLTVEVFVVLVALIGLTMTFGITGWYLAVMRWLASVDPTLYNKDLAIYKALYMARDFAVALGISYLTIAMAKSILRFPKTDATLDVLSRWASFFVPRVLLISGFLILFHYPFPISFIFRDSYLSVIVDPRLGGDSTHSDPDALLWTYWFALIGYAAIVFGLFAAAIWGFRRSVRSDVNGVGSTPVSPNNPSQAASPT